MTTTLDHSSEHAVAGGWRTLAIAGGAVGLVGLLAIAFPLMTGLSVTLGLGALLVASGIVHGVHAVTARGWRGSLWQLALGAVSVVAGLLLFASPAIGLVTLTTLVIAYLLVDAAAELWTATRMAGQPGRASIAVSGALSLVLAGLLWIGFPADATWAIGTLVGVGLLATGLSMVVVAMAGRDADAATAPASEPRGA